MREIRIYVEGGGDGKQTKQALRIGLDTFLAQLKDRARELESGWQTVACGSREDAYRRFRYALEYHPDAFNVLLVDAEAPVAAPRPWEHLESRDGWARAGAADDQCHLMVQLMEAWIIADGDSLAAFYGQGFNRKALPPSADVESVPKQGVLDALTRATRDTKKGKYHKTRHGLAALSRLDPDVVRRRARHCERLFQVIERELSQA